MSKKNYKIKLLTLLGFAQKSKNLISGQNAVEANLNQQRIKLLILAEDISEKVKLKWIEKAKNYSVPIIFFETKDILGKSIGKSSKGFIGIKDKQLAQTILKYRMELYD